MLPDRLVDMKLLPSPGRALVTSSRLENPGSAPGPKPERRIWRCTSRNSSEMRVRVRDQSTMPARSSETASIETGPCNAPAAGSAAARVGKPEAPKPVRVALFGNAGPGMLAADPDGRSSTAVWTLLWPRIAGKPRFAAPGNAG